ncbi:MAG: biotin-dependent carboxyltransferase family protein, partial [Anaerolineales bacterium]
AALEIGLSGAAFFSDEDCLIAAAGPGFALWMDDRPMPMWTAIYIRRNRVIRLVKNGPGNWAYLAVHGGIATPPVLGARAVYVRAPLGDAPARPLAPGDRLPVGSAAHPLLELAGRTLDPACIPYSPSPQIAVIPGPQAAQFSGEARAAFYTARFALSAASDRTGYRLSGPPIPYAGGEMVSEGMARGSVQIPPDGQPIVMQADSPTTGGYPKIAAVIRADQPILAQTPFDMGGVQFVETTIEAAQARYRALIQRLDGGIGLADAEREWL